MTNTPRAIAEGLTKGARALLVDDSPFAIDDAARLNTKAWRELARKGLTHSQRSPVGNEVMAAILEEAGRG